MVYSDPAVGAAYGYDFDGWNDAEDVFFYTGEGRVGAQRMVEGNAAILNHAAQGRALRVFEATDDRSGATSSKLHEYIGEFAVDVTDPYRIEDALDELGDERTVYVFKLRPVGDVLRNTANHSAAVESDAPTSELVPVEVHATTEFEQSPPVESVVAIRREAAMVADYQTYLEAQQHEVRRNKLTSPQTVKPIWTDLYDVTDNVLYEAKGSASRQSVRLAIGQLLDYRRYMLVQAPTLAVLLPARPNEEMVELLASLGIQTVYQTAAGHYLWSE
jgi:5-methylcytosine-specific restriction protein A